MEYQISSFQKVHMGGEAEKKAATEYYLAEAQLWVVKSIANNTPK